MFRFTRFTKDRCQTANRPLQLNATDPDWLLFHLELAFVSEGLQLKSLNCSAISKIEFPFPWLRKSTLIRVTATGRKISVESSDMNFRSIYLSCVVPLRSMNFLLLGSCLSSRSDPVVGACGSGAVGAVCCTVCNFSREKFCR